MRTMSEIEDMIRARQVQDQALAEIGTKIQACQLSKQNYDHLSERIKTLPDKLSHDVMVPFGKLAFMPGRLVHTNELLVHLGDAYFASMTCKQALKIIETRQKNLQETLTDLEKVSSNFKMKSQYLDEIKDAAEGQGFEIKEEVSENYLHPKDRRRTSRVEEKAGAGSSSQKDISTPPKDVRAEEHAALMARLDALQRMEEEEDEMCRLSDAENDSNTDSDDSASPPDDPVKKHVRFKEDSKSTTSEEVKAPPNTIRFKHSKTTVKKSDAMTPGDVHKLIQTQPKPILKLKQVVQDTDAPTSVITGNPHFKNAAVSDTVVERSAIGQTEAQTAPMPSKPVSKFKAARMKR